MLQNVNISKMVRLQPSVGARPLCFMVLSKVKPFKLWIELKTVNAPFSSIYVKNSIINATERKHVEHDAFTAFTSAPATLLHGIE